MSKQKPDSVVKREARLAAKLRENLHRRKDQSRQRQNPETPTDEIAHEEKRKKSDT
jgi:hypothetical protein